MHTFEALGPIAIEVRHTAGSVDIYLTDTDSTTVELSVTAAPAVPWLADLIGSLGTYGYLGDSSAALDRVIVNYSTTEQPDDTNGHHAPPDAAGDAVGDAVVDATNNTTADTAPDPAATATPGASYGRLLVDTRRAHLSGSSTISVRITAPLHSSIDARSESANLHLIGNAGDVTVRTVSGTVSAAAISAGDVVIRTVSGDAELGIHRGTLAAVTLDTVSGEISSHIPVHADPASPAREPDAQIHIHTVSGNIRLRRSPAP